MTAHRRAGAPRLIDWTGERCVPWAPDVQVVYEHLHRYMWAAEIIAGRRVLDVGSGEGFGAAILADRASEVVGIDIDERTVEHSQLNYAGAGLSFSVGSATDLSRFASGTFSAVVAFEIIEHVAEQEQVLAEICRVLADDGLLIISTPDRRPYSEATGQDNPFHVRELSLDEFSAMLAEKFASHAIWGQRTITGSHLEMLAAPGRRGEPGPNRSSVASTDFFVERAGDGWRSAPGTSPMYLVAVASPSPLPNIAAQSTLADAGIELVRTTERAVAELHGRIEQLLTEAAARNATARDLEVHVNHLSGMTAELQERIAAKEGELEAVSADLASARQKYARLEGSVTIQMFQKLSERVYSAIGQRSLLAHTLHATLRLLGRVVIRPKSGGPGAKAPAPAISGDVLVNLPQFEQPVATLVIPCHARADLTLSCLQSVAMNSAPVPYEVILIDDGADKETRQLLGRVAGAQVMRNKRNIGYIRSVNRAAAAARGRWLVLCNNDIEVRPGWLGALVGCGESAPDVGVVTPKYLNPDGTLAEAGAIVWQDGTAMNYGRGDPPDRPEYEFRRETDYGSAAALLVRADLWRRRGGFDERFLPMYYEDVDLCLDTREQGLRVMYEPEAVVVHHEGSTAGTDLASGPKRHQEENRPRLVAKWAARLEADHLRPNPKHPRRAADRNQGPHVLIMDARVPMADKDAGSLRMLHIIETLRGRGCRVSFAADNFLPVQPYTRALQQRGVQVLYDAVTFQDDLREIGPELDLVILSRPHQASRWLDVVREKAPNARVVYDTVDLHWLREARRGAIARHRDSLELGPKALALRELELAMVRATDVTFVVSDAERAQVEADVPGATVRVIPTVHNLTASVSPPACRAGVLFVGGFEHTPNIDAVIRLVRDVMPLVWREQPDVGVTIVGSSAPPEVEALAADRVELAGWVPDLEPVLDSARVLLAPLNYGAGLKGKITQSLAAGLPVVTTPIGAEGLEGAPGTHMLVAEDDEELAAGTIELLRSDELWLRLSSAGQKLIDERCSLRIMDERLGDLLNDRGPRGPRSAKTAELHL